MKSATAVYSALSLKLTCETRRAQCAVSQREGAQPVASTYNEIAPRTFRSGLFTSGRMERNGRTRCRILNPDDIFPVPDERSASGKSGGAREGRLLGFIGFRWPCWPC